MLVGRRTYIGKLGIDRMTLPGAVRAIDELVVSRRGGMVFTPNVDHIVQAETNAELERAYAAADLSLADGMPVLWASRLLGDRLPAKVSGSDLVVPLMRRAATRGWGVYILGGGPGTAALAAKALRERLAGLRVVGMSAPRVDLGDPPEAWEPVVADLASARPDIVLVGLGAPKQEVFIHRIVDRVRPAVLIGVGAALDFLAGVSRRAPAWVSASGLEWLHRLACDPRRLWRRYLLRDPAFARILWRTWAR